MKNFVVLLVLLCTACGESKSPPRPAAHVSTPPVAKASEQTPDVNPEELQTLYARYLQAAREGDLETFRAMRDPEVLREEDELRKKVGVEQNPERLRAGSISIPDPSSFRLLGSTRRGPVVRLEYASDELSVSDGKNLRDYLAITFVRSQGWRIGDIALVHVPAEAGDPIDFSKCEPLLQEELRFSPSPGDP